MWVVNVIKKGKISICFLLLIPLVIPIASADTTGIYMIEWFQYEFPPDGWEKSEHQYMPDLFPHWIQSNTNFADGPADYPLEAALFSENIDTSIADTAFLISKPIDTSNSITLTLWFNTYWNITYYGYDYFSPALDVFSRSDETDVWTQITPWEMNQYEFDTHQISMDVTHDIGPATQIKFEFNGFAWTFDKWCIDDVIIYSLPGDIDMNMAVDIVDLGILLRSFGYEVGDDMYNILADFNRDNIVDIQDLGILLGYYNMVIYIPK